MNNKSVYIIIPVHNRKAFTLGCLKNLKTNSDLQKYHVIVVDDGSSGRSYGLDIIDDKVRKPNSLFIEAYKP